MPSQILLYKEIFPLFPDAEWITSRDLYELLQRKLARIKLSTLRVNLNQWEKRGLVISKPKEVEAVLKGGRYFYVHHPKMYRKAVSVYHGHTLMSPAKNSQQRRCLGCGNVFWQEGKYNFMCSTCAGMYHD